MRVLPKWLSPRRLLNPKLFWPSYAKTPLPPGARQALRDDNPRLQELRRRYAASDLPMTLRSQWSAGYVKNQLRLTHFRGDNAYVWQFRNVGKGAHEKYHAYLRHLAEVDRAGLLRRLKEDGLFGCWTFSYDGWPPVSRDLLDSVNELSFLERHVQVLSRPGTSVLDIGAGYGRLAWRALEAAPGLGSYLCADAIPESTFLCEYHLGFRGCRAEVVPLDEFDARVAGRRIDLAVSVHALSEMSLRAIEGWISRLPALGVRWVFILDHPKLRSREPDGSQREYEQSVLAANGYRRLVRERIVPAELGAFMKNTDEFHLFELTGGHS
jgi:hypothetical protein